MLERFAASVHWTLQWSSIGVRFPMRFQPVTEGKAFSASFNGAHERQLVHFLVPVKLWLGEERFAANLAKVRLLSRVNVHVIRELPGMIELFAAYIANVLPFHCRKDLLRFIKHLGHLAQACVGRVDVKQLWRGFHIRLVVGHQLPVRSKQLFRICGFQIFKLDPSPLGHRHFLLGFFMSFFLHLQGFHEEFLGIAFIFFFQ